MGLVRTAKKVGYQTVFLTTNGRMLANSEFLQAIRDAGLDRLYLSIHGHSADIHDKAVGAPGAYDQVCLAIENLNACGQPFGISSVIYKGNVNHLEGLARLVVDSGAMRAIWAFVRPAGGAREGFQAVVPRFDSIHPHLERALDLSTKAGVPITDKVS